MCGFNKYISNIIKSIHNSTVRKLYHIFELQFYRAVFFSKIDLFTTRIKCLTLSNLNMWSTTLHH